MIKLMTSDEELLFAYRGRGDKAALEKLIARKFEASYRRALALLGDPAAADDAVQEALISLIRGARRFREGSAFDPWWSRILLNRIRNEARKLRAQKKRDLVVGQRRSREAQEQGPRDHAVLHQGLAELPLDLREPLVLHYFEGRSHKAVGETLDIPAGTASSRIRRGLERLRGKLEAGGHGAVAAGLEKALSRLGRAAVDLPKAPVLSALESLALKASVAALLTKAAALVILAALALLGAELVAGSKQHKSETERRARAARDQAPTFSGSRLEAPRRSGAKVGEARDPKAKAAPVSTPRTAPAMPTASADVHSLPARAAAPAAAGAAREAALEVFVRDERGRAVSGARLALPESEEGIGFFQLEDLDYEPPTTDARGRALLPASRASERRVLAYHEGLSGEALAPKLDGEDQRLTITLSAADRARPGRAALVLSLTSLQGPLRRAPVSIELQDSGGRRSMSRDTDSLGRLYWNDLHPGTCYLRVSTRGFSSGNLVCELTKDRRRERNLSLSRGGAIAGDLLIGAEAEFVLVQTQELISFGPTAEWSRTVSASVTEDRYRFDNLRPGVYRISARTSEGLEIIGEARAVEGEVTEGPRLSIEQGGDLTGILVDTSGAPMRGMALSIAPVGADWSSGQIAVSDDSGRFRFRALAHGAYELSVTGYQGRALLARRLTITGDADLGILRTPSTRSLAVSVVDEAGAPLDEAELWFLAAAETEGFASAPPWRRASFHERRGNRVQVRGGRIDLNALPAGPIAFLAVARGASSDPRRLELEPGLNETLTLRVKHRLARLFGEASKLTGAELILVPEFTLTPFAFRQARVVEEAFAFERLIPGSYRLYAPGRSPRSITLAAGEARELDLGIDDRASPLEVRIAGRPEGETPLVKVSWDGPRSAVNELSLPVGDRGLFRAAPAGPVRVELTHTLGANLAARDDRFLVFTLARELELSPAGSRVDFAWPGADARLSGRLPADASAYLRGEGLELFVSPDDREGPFEFALPAGRYRVFALPSGAAPGRGDPGQGLLIELRPGERRALGAIPELGAAKKLRKK